MCIRDRQPTGTAADRRTARRWRSVRSAARAAAAGETPAPGQLQAHSIMLWLRPCGRLHVCRPADPCLSGGCRRIVRFSDFGLERAPALLQGTGRERAPLLSALPMERQLCAGNRDDLGNLQGAGMWQPSDPRSAPAGASPLRPSQHCCRYGPRQHCSFHRPPAAPCLLFSMHEGYASRQTAPFVGCALQMPNGSPDHTASSLWLRPRSVSPAIPFASNAASHSSARAIRVAAILDRRPHATTQ